MQHVAEYREQKAAAKLVQALKAEATASRRYRFMEFCGGHTHAIYRYGLQTLFPKNIQMIHGPGCPVCILPIARIQNAIDLALTPGVILVTYADMMRVPGAHGMTLNKAKAAGADVRMVYSALETLHIAEQHRDRDVLFFAVGFETTIPATAYLVKQAEKLGLKNLSIFSNHVLTPSAMLHILEAPEMREQGAPLIEGFLGPGHVSAVIGFEPYEFFAQEYQRPVVISGFEPIDILLALLKLVRQVNEGRAEVENAYPRVVTRSGNRLAQSWVADIFELRPQFEWRGLGWIPYSGLKIKKEFSLFDAERRFEIKPYVIAENKACQCSAILRGLKEPYDCALFGKGCSPENPIGSCMVSNEGACAAAYAYQRNRLQ